MSTRPSQSAQRLRDLRVKAGLSVAEFARRVGCVRSYIYALESGVAKSPSRVFLNRVAQAVGVDPAWLASGSATSKDSQQQVTSQGGAPAPGGRHYLAHVRKELGWSQAQMAKFLGVNRSYLSQVENCRRRCSDRLLTLARKASDEFTAGDHPANTRHAPRDPISGDDLARLADTSPAVIYADIDFHLERFTEDELRMAAAFFRANDGRKMPVLLLCERMGQRILQELAERGRRQASGG